MKKLWIAAAILVLILLGCKNPDTPIPEDTAGTLVITIADDVNARILAPALSMTATSYAVSGLHEKGESFSANVSATEGRTSLSKLLFGDWTVTVNALNGDSPTPTIIGTGSKRITVHSNETTEASVTVYPVVGKGKLSLSPVWTGSLENPSASATLTPDFGAEPPISFSFEESGETYLSESLDAGYYTLALQVYDTGSLVTGAVETVRIVAGQTTAGTIMFSNIKGPGGAVAASVLIDLRNPIWVSIARDDATADTAAMLNLLASQTGAKGTPSYNWYLNGGSLPSGSIVDGPAVHLPVEDLEPGTYRIDALAKSASQAGSGFFMMQWQGSLAAAPAPAQADWAYYDTTMGLPYYWDGSEWRKFSANLLSVGPAGEYAAIQAAIDASTPGRIIKIASGSFDGTVEITKRITLVGSGSGIDGTLLTNTSMAFVVASHRPVILISASGEASQPILIKGMRILPKLGPGHAAGVLMRPASTLSHIELDDIKVFGNAASYPLGTSAGTTAESGIYVENNTNLSHLKVSNSEFSDTVYGIIFANNLIAAPTKADHIEILDTTIARNTMKGFYAEKLSEASFRNLRVIDNGDPSKTPSWADWSNAGIDINLKFADYEDILFDNLLVSGNGLGSYGGAGLTIKARGSSPSDTSYAAKPATLKGVRIQGGSFQGNQVGIRFGEIRGPVGPNYLDPSSFDYVSLASPTEVSIAGASIAGNIKAELMVLIEGLSLTGEVRSY